MVECYMLDIGIDELRYQKIWIRTEYLRIFNYVQELSDHDWVHNLAPAIVIAGQPGIGESFVASWPTYILLT